VTRFSCFSLWKVPRSILHWATTPSTHFQHADLPQRHLSDGGVLLRLQELLDGHYLVGVFVPAFHHQTVRTFPHDGYLFVFVHVLPGRSFNSSAMEIFDYCSKPPPPPSVYLFDFHFRTRLRGRYSITCTELDPLTPLEFAATTPQTITSKLIRWITIKFIRVMSCHVIYLNNNIVRSIRF
jgi:hypothetical protein